MSLRRRTRLLLLVLAAVVGLVVVAGVGVIQIVGREIGSPCPDSYACRGFLIGGAECVDVDGASYCTRRCRQDAECRSGWRCLGAHPTVLTVETRAVGKVCVRGR